MSQQDPDPHANLRAELFGTSNGSIAHDALKKLDHLTKGGDRGARRIVEGYAIAGDIPHMRTYATARLADLAQSGDVELAKLFERLLADPVTRYWAIKGIARSCGANSYPSLVAIACDRNMRTEDRANAVKQLAKASGQVFDRGLPSDPGKWRERDLRLDEVTQWASTGFPQGSGYPPLPRDPALDDPKTDFERLIAQLDSILARKRIEDDQAEPRNRLVPADAADMEAISARWKLPGNYLTFLRRFSPVRTILTNRRFYNGGLSLYGASELIDRQFGYAFDGDGRAITEWPEEHLVIADHAGDPFVLDLSRANGADAPVCTAEHGTGDWEFHDVAETFELFLKSLVK